MSDFKVVFYCESRNQVDLFLQIAGELPRGITARFAYACWDGVITAWVRPALRAVSDRYDSFNILETVAAHHTTKIRQDRKFIRSGLISAIDDCLAKFDPGSTLIVLGNDVSQRGAALAHVARNRSFNTALVQDGFLDFVSKTGSLGKTDQNYLWGKSHPDRLYVWGQAFKDALVERHGPDPASIVVSGPLRTLGTKSSSTGKPDKLDGKSVPSVLWMDQAILDQRKAPADAWKKEFEAIAISLSIFNTTVRLHPSTSSSNRKALGALAEPFVDVEEGNAALTQEYLRRFDYVVCYYSTVFIDAVDAGVPCLVYKTQSLDIELPEFADPCISYHGSLETLTAQIRTGIAPTKVPNLKPLSDYVAAEPIPASVVAEQLAELLDERRASDREYELPSDVRPPGVPMLEGRKIAVLAGTIGRKVGAGIPIQIFNDFLERFGATVSCTLVAEPSLIHILENIAGADVVIVNSLEVIKAIDPPVLDDVLKYCRQRKVEVLFYLHETEYVFRTLLDSFEARMRHAIQRILPRHRVLCVGTLQSKWLNKLGVKNTCVVYNASFSQIALRRQPATATTDAASDVVMVGTQQPRKGVTLFSEVADLCGEVEPDVPFKWYGARVSVGRDEYRSPRAEFFGHTPSRQVEQAISRARVYFLSSIDDPFPLSALEAVAAGVPIVAYARTGMAEVIETYRNGEIFERYSPQSAFAAVRRVLENREWYSEGCAQARRSIDPQQFVGDLFREVREALIRRDAALERAPLIRSTRVITRQAVAATLPPVAGDFSEIDRIRADFDGKKKIELAKEAIEVGNYARAFRISASALRSTPASSRHYGILSKAVPHLGADEQAKFDELSKLHKSSRS